MLLRWLLTLVVLGLAGDALAVDPRISATALASHWMAGRYIMPVTCLRTDGTRVEVESAVVVKPDSVEGDKGLLPLREK